MNDIEYPDMRSELEGYLDELANPDRQLREWGKSTEATSTLDYSVHFLFDDTALASDPISCIGIILKNGKEAEAIRILTKSLELLFEKYGTELSDTAYVRKPEWEAVTLAAQKAKDILS